MQKKNYKMAIRKYRKAIKYQDLCWEMPDLDQGYVTLIIYTNLKNRKCLNMGVILTFI